MSKKLVIGVHGIFDRGNWNQLSRVFRDHGFDVGKADYPLTGLGRLWFPPSRKLLAEKIHNKIQQYCNAHSDAEITIVAHSLGTYLACQALIRSNIRIHRLILCGAILPLEFPFHVLSGSVTAKYFPIINECGAVDVWPPLCQAFTWGFGDTGTQGVGSVFVQDRFHKGGHSTFFSKEFAEEFWLGRLFEIPEGENNAAHQRVVKLGLITEDQLDKAKLRKCFIGINEEPCPPKWLMFLVWLPIKWVILLLLLWGVYGVVNTTYRFYVHEVYGRNADDTVAIEFKDNAVDKLSELENSSNAPLKLASELVATSYTALLSKATALKDTGKSLSTIWGTYVPDRHYVGCNLRIKFQVAVLQKDSTAVAFILKRQPDGRVVVEPQYIQITDSNGATLLLQSMNKGDRLILILNLTVKSDPKPTAGGISCNVL